jgi:uncharacterized protein
MKHISTFVNTVLAAVLILLLLAISSPNIGVRAAAPTLEPQPTQAPVTTCIRDRSIQVSGAAVVNVQPDRALVQLGVQSNGDTPKEVQAGNAAAIRDVIRALKTLGIDDRDISTNWYMIEPLYEDYDSLQIKGYRIHNLISITVRDMDRTSEAIAAAFQAGANQVVNVEFYTSELRKYRDQAREMAMKAAGEKASALARAAEAETDCVVNISENSWSYFNGWNWWSGGNSQNMWTQNAVQNVAPSGSGTSSGDGDPVSAGQISVRAEVSVTYALK